ncbi:hypothetical protein [Thiohalorhabdus methylotrophus]|uniref:T3SS negative regulator,GrlR n=1 Tax=Thiohalorhabdus methylotrophus TaxID=3242694 RepID=A0ABV4TQI8_9GAMM
MDTQALWSAVFSDETGPHSGGVILLQHGHLHGGDNNYHYQGSYREEGGNITLTFSATHFHGGRNHIAGNRDAFTLHVSGPLAERAMELCGELEEDSAKKVTVRLQRVAELPVPGPSTV